MKQHKGSIIARLQVLLSFVFSKAVDVPHTEILKILAGDSAARQSRFIPPCFTAGRHPERPPLFDYGHLGPQIPPRKTADIVLTQVDTYLFTCKLASHKEL